MTEPCNKGPDIDKLNTKVDALIDAHTETSKSLKQAIDKLTSIIMTDIETRAEVEQLKKDREIIYSKLHGLDARTDKIEVRNAKCDGAGIFEKFPVVWDWMMSEKGWRRMIPGACAIISVMIAAYVALGTPHTHKIDPTHKTSVGVDISERE